MAQLIVFAHGSTVMFECNIIDEERFSIAVEVNGLWVFWEDYSIDQLGDMWNYITTNGDAEALNFALSQFSPSEHVLPGVPWSAQVDGIVPTFEADAEADAEAEAEDEDEDEDEGEDEAEDNAEPEFLGWLGG